MRAAASVESLSGAASRDGAVCNCWVGQQAFVSMHHCRALAAAGEKHRQLVVCTEYQMAACRRWAAQLTTICP